MKRLLVATILLSTPVFAQRSFFPDDYKTNACAPANSCVTSVPSEVKGAAGSFFGYDLDIDWTYKHDAELRAAFEPICRKHAACLTVPDNLAAFCSDMLRVEVRNVCARKYPDPRTHDGEQCLEYADVFSLSVDQHTAPLWRAARECALKNPVQHTKPLDVWMSPESVPYGYSKDVAFYALDPDTHIPVFARVKIEDHILYAPANPTGETATYYPFPLPFHYLRVPNADGHSDLVPPMITISTPDYPIVTFRLNTPPPAKITAVMTPPASKLHRGENKVTVTTRDPADKPVEMRVMAGERAAGPSNEPITIVWPKNEKRPEIWVTSLFNVYNDVVVAK